MRIAREIHRPISEVLEYPSTELNYWAVVFQEEYYETHQHERYKSGMTECGCAEEIEKFKRLLKWENVTHKNKYKDDGMI